MIYGSVCSGIEAATQAWHPLGWNAAFFSEIEAFPSAVLAHHYPDVPNLGDMTKFKEWPDATIDVLVGGTPCQSFSVAGLRRQMPRRSALQGARELDGGQRHGMDWRAHRIGGGYGMINLYPDQADLVTRVRSAMRQHKGVLMQSATGSGKTRMALDMIGGAHSKGSTAIFTVPRKELLRQTIDTIREYNIPFGVISPDHPPNPFAKIQIAMTPTLARRLDKLKAPSALFLDETHFGGADLDRIIQWSKDGGGWRIGLSATPLKTNGKPMGDWYDHMECGLPVDDLIEAGRLSKYRYFAPSKPDLSGIKVTNGNYVQSQLDEYMEGQSAIIGDAVRTYRETAPGKLNVVFATSRKHSGKIKDAFVDAGIPAMTIDGTMDDIERKRIIRGFARREFTVLINVQLLNFGFDLAASAGMDVTVESMSDLSPCKSLPLQMQKWGRVLRAKDFPAIIMDHAGNWSDNGLPDDPRDWTLDGSKKRGMVGEAAPPVRQCPTCFFCHHPAPICPSCGFIYPINSRMVEEIDGELAEIDKAAIERARIAKRAEQGRAETLDDLIAFAKRTGKNPRWAQHVWNARQAKKAG